MDNYAQISSRQLDEIIQTLATTMATRDSLQDILDTMVNAVMVIATDTTISRANRAACELLDLPAQSLVGKPVNIFLADGISWERTCQTEVVHQGAVRNREVWFKKHSGERVPVLLSASVLRSEQGRVEGFVCAVLDISEHIRMREAVKASRDDFRSIVEKSADGVLILCQDGHVKYLNDSAMTLLGREKFEMIGMPFGFPVISGEVTEVDIVRKNGALGIAEMRTIDTCWYGQDALLVSLRDVTENVRLQEQLRQLSMEDDMTGLNNRRGFLLLAEQELRAAERRNSRLTLFFIDLDGLKRINDTLGHKVGDQAIIETATILRKLFRRSDILARLGGDEFLALSFDTGEEDHGAQIVERLEAEIKRRNDLPGRFYQLSVSIGSVPIPNGSDRSIESHIRDADKIMYTNKRAKKMDQPDSLSSPTQTRTQN